MVKNRLENHIPVVINSRTVGYIDDEKMPAIEQLLRLYKC